MTAETQTPLSSHERRRYRRPPIVESVLEIRYVQESSELTDLLKSKLSLSEGWTFAGEITEHKMEFAGAPTPHSSASHQSIGVRLESRDKGWVILLRNGGISVSRLEPYETWESHLGMAEKIFRSIELEKLAGSLTRIALRTINRLSLPLPLNDLSVYLRTYPQLSKDMPQMMSSAFMHLVLPNLGTYRLSANITEASVPSTKPGTAAIILDIDVYLEHDVPQSLDLARSHIEGLHDCRNALFEACITDITRSLFDT